MNKFIILIILIACSYPAFSQEAVKITGNDQTGYPIMKTKLFVFDKLGNPDFSTDKSSFVIRDEGINSANIIDISCNSGVTGSALSAVLTFDLALSVNNSLPSNFDLGMSALKSFVNKLDTSRDEFALTSYDVMNYMKRDFTKDKSKILSDISLLKPSRGSLFNTAFLDEPAGALKIDSIGKNSRAIFIITDGTGELSAEIVNNLAATSGTKIFALVIGRKISEKLKTVINQTGGFFIDKITTNEEISPAVNTLIAMARGFSPCVITWEAPKSCLDSHNVEISVPALLAKDDFNYYFQNSEKSTIISDPPYLGFSSVAQGKTKDLSLTLVAKNGDVNISYLEIDSPFFITDGDVVDYLLKKDQFLNVTIEYDPIDSAIVFSELKIHSDACIVDPIYITGGFPNYPPHEVTVKIAYPNGKEVFIPGDTIDIKWLGLLPKDIVQLKYSLDGGETWETIANNVTGLSKKWVIPDTVTTHGLVKVIQLWPNNVGKTLDLLHKGQVNCAFFNAEGDLIVTASNDTTAVVWVAGTGEKKFVLKGHKKPVVWAQFDPLDRWVATAGEDSIAMIWDLITGDTVATLRDHTAKLLSVEFSADGKYLVTCDFLGVVNIWSTGNWKLLKSIDSNGGYPVWFATFNPMDSSKVITANYGGDVKVWNWIDYTPGASPIKVFSSGSLNIKHVTYNRDATKIAATTSTSNPKYVLVWDVTDNSKTNYTTNDTLYTISHNNDTTQNNAINFSSFFYLASKNKELILTSGSDNTARLWDAENGKPATINEFFNDNVFVEHTNSVQTAVFDKYGSRVLTASWDKTAKIWNLNQKELQTDSSDNAFSIVRPDVSVTDVMFPDIVTGEVADTVVTSAVMNKVKFNYQLKTLDISDDADNSFAISGDNNLPVTFDPLGEEAVELRFYPKTSGTKTAKLVAGVPLKSVSGNLMGNAINRDLNPSPILYDFGTTYLGNYIDTITTALVVNTTSQKVDIDSIVLSGTYRNDFAIVSGSNIKSLNGGEALPAVLRFQPKELGRKNAQLIVYFQGLGSPAKINLWGTSGNISPDSAMIFPGDVSGAPGETINLPIMMTNYSNNGFLAKAAKIRFDLTFNATLLEPVGENVKDVLNGNSRTVTYEINSLPDANGVLGNLQFKVGLGNDTVSVLQLSNSRPANNALVKLRDSSGLFSLTGVCRDENGNVRLIEPNGSNGIMPVTPNPVVDVATIKYSLNTASSVKLYIIDASGRLVKSLVDGYQSGGEYSYKLNTTDIPSGAYTYVLELPFKRYTGKLEIKK